MSNISKFFLMKINVNLLFSIRIEEIELNFIFFHTLTFTAPILNGIQDPINTFFLTVKL